jgi:AraC family transcriptional regulator, regulatory protein of adaptative response / methylated-DNA-[protein]-cysteine methyltransferase
METAMLSPDRVDDCDRLGRAAADYAVVRRAIAFVAEHWREQPEIEAIAAAAGVSASELHHLFRRWASITPKAFLQALTLEHARRILRDSASVLDAAFEVGLSGPSRLHDLFVTHQAMSPGEWKSGGAGLTMSYGFHPSPFGTALVMTTQRGLAGLAFADADEEQAVLADMKSRWPRADIIEDRTHTALLARRIFDAALWRAAARGAHRHRFRGARLGNAAQNSDGPSDKLLRDRYEGRCNQSRARGGRRSRQESALVRGAMPPRAGQAW